MLKGLHTGLRAIETADLPHLLEWRNRPEYRRYFREYRELGMEHQKEWYEQKVKRDDKTVMFAIVELACNRLVGASGLCYINWLDRNADFSIYIGANNLYIDENFAPDAAKTMIQYAFEELGLHRLWAEIYDFDESKKNLFEVLGFTLEGCHRQTHWAKSRWHNSLFYSLLADEY